MSRQQPSRSQSHKVIDESARNRRARLMLEKLEKDNVQDDPHANLSMHKKAPKFEDTTHSEEKKRRSKKRNAEYYRLRSRKNFEQLLAEDPVHAEKYFRMAAGESDIPPLHLCGVCGLLAAYTCVTCGTRFCKSACFQTHKDTRCLKFMI